MWRYSLFLVYGFVTTALQSPVGKFLMQCIWVTVSRREGTSSQGWFACEDVACASLSTLTGALVSFIETAPCVYRYWGRHLWDFRPTGSESQGELGTTEPAPLMFLVVELDCYLTLSVKVWRLLLEAVPLTLGYARIHFLCGKRIHCCLIMKAIILSLNRGSVGIWWHHRASDQDGRYGVL